MPNLRTCCPCVSYGTPFLNLVSAPVVSASETPDLTPPSPPAPSRGPPPSKPPLSRRPSSSLPTNQAVRRLARLPSLHANREHLQGPSSHTKGARQGAETAPPQPDEDSVTEEEPEEEDYAVVSVKLKPPAENRSRANMRDSSPVRSVLSKRATPDDRSPLPKSRASTRRSPQPQSSSPLPAPKRAKRGKATQSSSDEGDSEEERKRHLARLKGNGTTRGAKQPLKRGGRRF